MKGRLKTYIGFSDDLCVNCFVDKVHATELMLSTDRVAWAPPANHLRFQ